MQASSISKSKKIQPTKKSPFWTKFWEAPSVKCVLTKQARPIGTQAGITWRPMGVLQPIHFILSAIGRQCSSVLSRFKTVQIQTLRKRKIGITLISSLQRNAGCVSKSEYSVSAELVSWSSGGGVGIQDGGRPPWIRSESVVKLTLSGQISNLNLHIESSVRFILGLIPHKKLSYLALKDYSISDSLGLYCLFANVYQLNPI